MAGFGITPPYIHPLSKPQPNAGGRQAAIAHHMGAPKQHAKAPSKPAAKPKAPPKAPRSPKAAKAPPGIGNMNQGDVHNKAVTLARLERNASLAPLQSQAKEIGANEQGVQQRYGQLVGAANTQAEHLQQGQAASAKTFENQAAENALTAGKAIETAGQTQALMTGGYTSPELRAQMALSSQQAAGQGGAGSAFAQSVAASGASNIAQMRGAASLNALGGSQQITNAFQKQAAQNQQAQQGVIGKVAPRAAELEEKIGQANFSDKAVMGKLAFEGVKLKQAGELGRGKIAATKEGNQLTRLTGIEGNRARAADLKFKENNAKVVNGIANLNANDQKKYHEAETRYKNYVESHGGKPPDPTEGRKYMGELERAATIASHSGIRRGLTGQALKDAKKKARETITTTAKGTIPNNMIEAAFNLAYYGRLSATDRAVAESYGLTKEIRPHWFRTK